MPRHVTIDTVDPTTAPASVGAHWINEATGDHFLANGTASVANWVQGGGGTGGGGGGGASNTTTFQALFFQPGVGANPVNIVSDDFGRSWKRTGALESSAGAALANPKIGAQPGQPTKLLVMLDRTSNYIIKVSVDSGNTWEELGGAGGWAPNAMGNNYEMFAGYDSRSEYMVITAGTLFPFDAVFSYNGTVWGPRQATSGVNDFDGIYDLQGGVADAFFMVESASGNYNILKTTDLGALWTKYVDDFNFGTQIVAMAIDPTLGIGFVTGGLSELYIGDGNAAPAAVPGSAGPMIGFTPFAIFGGNGKFIIFGSDGGTQSRVYCYDGTSVQEGAIMAYDQTLSSPDTGRADGRPQGVKCYWDGDGYAAFIPLFAAGSAEANPIWMRSADGLIWVEDPFRRPALANTYDLDQNQWAVISQ